LRKKLSPREAILQTLVANKEGLANWELKEKTGLSDPTVAKEIGKLKELGLVYLENVSTPRKRNGKKKGTHRVYKLSVIAPKELLLYKLRTFIEDSIQTSTVNDIPLFRQIKGVPYVVLTEPKQEPTILRGESPADVISSNLFSDLSASKYSKEIGNFCCGPAGQVFKALLRNQL